MKEIPIELLAAVLGSSPFDALPPEQAEDACDCGYLSGYLAGIHALSGHLLDVLDD